MDNVSQGIAGDSGKTQMNAEDDLKFLRSGEQDEAKVGDEEIEEKEDKDDEEDEEDSKEGEDNDDVEEDEEKEDEEDEEETEEEPEPTGSLITAKDLKGKYPDIFKKFPELRSVIYREQQYSTIFVDPKEAQEAANNSDSFKEIESNLVSGQSAPLFKAIKIVDGADFNKLAAGILPALKEVDEAVFMEVIAVPLKQILRAALAHGKNSKDKNLEFSAQHIHNYIFSDMELDSKAKFESELKADKTNPEEDKYKKKLEELNARDHKAFKVEVDKEWLDGVRESFFDKFDPDGAFTKWAKDKMFQDCIVELNKQFSADARFQKSLEALWRQAKSQSYNPESKSRIVATALARAKQIIPQVRSSIRSAALAKEKSEDNKKKPFKVVKKEGQQQRSKPSSRDTSKMSDLDIIRGT